MTLTINQTSLPCAACESHAPSLRDIIIRQGGRYGNLELHLAASMNSPLEPYDGIPVADMVHWCHPSAELVAKYLETRQVFL